MEIRHRQFWLNYGKFPPKSPFWCQDRRFQFEIWNPRTFTQQNPRRACTKHRGENEQRTGNGRGGHLSEFEIWNFGYSDFEFFGEETFLVNQTPLMGASISELRPGNFKSKHIRLLVHSLGYWTYMFSWIFLGPTSDIEAPISGFWFEVKRTVTKRNGDAMHSKILTPPTASLRSPLHRRHRRRRSIKP